MNRRSGQTDRQMDRQAVERTDRWMSRKMDTLTKTNISDRQSNIHTHTHTHTQTDRHKHREREREVNK
jgi:hypothetical protein